MLMMLPATVTVRFAEQVDRTKVQWKVAQPVHQESIKTKTMKCMSIIVILLNIPRSAQLVVVKLIPV
jgi:hypothetical protein